MFHPGTFGIIVAGDPLPETLPHIEKPVKEYDIPRSDP
jgi:hypothetical protein